MENKTTTSPLENDSIIYFDGKNELAHHAAKLLFGNGWALTADKPELEKLLNGIFEKNNINEFLYSLGYWLSVEGRVIATVSKNKAGKYHLEIARPKITNQVGKIHVTPKLAVLYKTVIISSNNYLVREDWDSEKVVRTFFNGKNTEEQISLQTVNAKIRPEERIPRVWYHRLGFVPIIEFLNKPINSQTIGEGALDSSAYKKLSDDFAVANIPNLINHIYRQIERETVLNHTRVIGTFNSQEAAKLAEKSESIKYLVDNLLINVKSMGGQGQVPPFQLVAPTNGYITELIDTIKKLKAQYYDGAGYSTQDDTVIDTATQTLYAKTKDVETTKLKRDYITEKMNQLIEIIIKLEGGTLPETSEDRTFSFEINENLNVSEVETTALVIQQLQAGLITKAEAIAKLRGIKEKDADPIVKKIDKEQEKQMEQDAKLGLIVNGEGEGGENGDTNTDENKPPTE